MTDGDLGGRVRGLLCKRMEGCGAGGCRVETDTEKLMRMLDNFKRVYV